MGLRQVALTKKNDTEIFSWEGFPKENELPANFQIDYIRSWQLIKNTQRARHQSFK